MPWEIITDNGSQFVLAKFKDFYEDIGTKICFASIGHLELNGAIENLLAGLMKRLAAMLKVL